MLIKISTIRFLLLALQIVYTAAHPIAVKVSNTSLPAAAFLSKQKTAIQTAITTTAPAEKSPRLFEWLTNMFTGQPSSHSSHSHDYDDCDYDYDHHDDYHHSHHGHGHSHDYYDEHEHGSHGHGHGKNRRPTNRPITSENNINQNKVPQPHQSGMSSDQSKVVITTLPMNLAVQNGPSGMSSGYGLNAPQQQYGLHRPIRVRARV